MEAENKVMMIFVGFAIIVGVICGLADLSGLQGLALGLVFFYVSYKLPSVVLNLEESSYEAGAWNMIKTGIIPYWFILLVFWILIYTVTF